MSSLLVVLTGLGNGFVDLVMLPWTIWQWFGMEVLKERMIALTMAGQSIEFLYMMLSLVLTLLVLGLISRRFLKATVLCLEGFNRKIGQFSAWFVLLLMLQQVMIIVMGQVFRGNELLFSPFGMQLSNAELQWLSGQLKFYNAILISFASAYTFIEGGHVRVDLVYGNLGYRAKRFIDFLGSVFFMLPATILLWWFAWPLATNSVFAQRPMNIFSDKASWRGVKLETSGTAEFTWVWAFKVLILIFAALLFIQAVAFMLRNVWALLSRGKNVESHPTEPDPVVDTTAIHAEHMDNLPAEIDPDIHLGRPENTISAPVAGSDARSAGANTPADTVVRTHPRLSSGADKNTSNPAASGVSVRQRARQMDRKNKHGSDEPAAAPSLAPAGLANRTPRGQ